MCQMLDVRCQVSDIRCQVSGAKCHMFSSSFFFFFIYKELELVFGGSVINGAYPGYLKRYRLQETLNLLKCADDSPDSTS